MQRRELALKTVHVLLLRLHVVREFSLPYLDLFDTPLETLKGRLMLLLVFLVPGLLGVLVHGQSAIALDDRIFSRNCCRTVYSLRCFPLANK